MTEDYRELLLGCGRARDKRIWPKQTHRRAGDHQFGLGLVTLDVNFAVSPDLWCDLNSAPPWYVYPHCYLEHTTGIAPKPDTPQASGAYQTAFSLLPDYWDEIHAYEVLEHLGSLGDQVALLRQFAELWRLLKPDGYLCCTVPSRFSVGLWGDPSHRRVINPMTLVFLDQSEYVKQCDAPRPTAMSDFRGIYKADFRCIDAADNRETFSFILQAVKPTRWRDPICRCSDVSGRDQWCALHSPFSYDKTEMVAT